MYNLHTASATPSTEFRSFSAVGFRLNIRLGRKDSCPSWYLKKKKKTQKKMKLYWLYITEKKK